MLTSYEGLYAIIPTPAKEGAGHLLARDTVDLDETSRVIEKLIAAGAGGVDHPWHYG